MKVSLIICAAGKGERAKLNKNKLLVPFNGKTVLERTVSAFMNTKLIDQYVVTSSKEDLKEIKSLLSPFNVTVVLGGETRTDSVKNALKKVTGDIVLIHDGARPFVTKKIIKDCITSAEKYGSGIVAVPSSDTVCLSDGKEITSYLGKSGIYDVQTPQGFKTEEIIKAYKNAKGKTFNDDGEVYKNTFNKLNVVLGDKNNIKLTYPEDFSVLEKDVLRKFGTGFDCHKLVKDRKLILGGIEIPHTKGLLGHSDADVLIHALMDAMLSACALRDIGYYFPDTDYKYKDISSVKLLKEVIKLLKEKGYRVESVSAVIMAEKPKLLNHIPKIKQNICKLLKLSEDDVGISATTLEGLGFVGREEGISVQSTAVLIKE